MIAHTGFLIFARAIIKRAAQPPVGIVDAAALATDTPVNAVEPTDDADLTSDPAT
jgi:hypothetical protein